MRSLTRLLVILFAAGLLIGATPTTAPAYFFWHSGYYVTTPGQNVWIPEQRIWHPEVREWVPGYEVCYPGRDAQRWVDPPPVWYEGHYELQWVYDPKWDDWYPKSVWVPGHWEDPPGYWETYWVAPWCKWIEGYWKTITPGYEEVIPGHYEWRDGTRTWVDGWWEWIPDPIPPTISVSATPPFPRAGQPVTVAWSSSDSGGGVYYTELWCTDNGTGWLPWEGSATSGSVSITPIAGHAYSCTATAWDRDDNEATATVSFTPDSTKPTVTISAPTQGVAGTPFNVSWSATDGTGSGVASYEVTVSVNGSAATLWKSGSLASDNGSYTGAAGSIYTFAVRATDKAGNVGDWATATVQVGNAPKSITLTPAVKTLNIGESVTFVATGTYDNQPAADVTGQVQFSSSSAAVSMSGATATANSVGTATITATHTVTGLKATATVTAADTTAPQVAFYTPTANSTVKGSITAGVTATDNVAVSKVEFQVDGGTPTTATPPASGSTYTFTWDTTAVSNGAHMLSAIAYDAAGNTRSALLAVTVLNDKAKPTVMWLQPAAEATVWGSTLLSVSAQDDVKVEKVDFAVDGSLEASVLVGSSTYEYNLSTGLWANGTHTLSATAYDTAGNTTTASRIVYFLNTSDPDIGINRNPTTFAEPAKVYSLAPEKANFSFQAQSGYSYTLRVRDEASGRVVWTYPSGPILSNNSTRYFNLIWDVKDGVYPAMEGSYLVELEMKSQASPAMARTFSRRFPVEPNLRGILYIPGITGSTLMELLPSGEDDSRWIPDTSEEYDDMQALRMDPSGRPLHSNVRATGVIDALLFDAGWKDLGKNLVMSLNGMGYSTYQGALPLPAGPFTSGVTAMQLGYDWRYHPEELAGAIDNAVNQLMLSSGSKKVVLVAHSMGGLLFRNYLYGNPGRQQKVAQLVTIGSPLRGTPKAAKMLYHGDPVLPVFFAVDPAIVKDVGPTFPSSWVLLPSPSYLQNYTDWGEPIVDGYVHNPNGSNKDVAESRDWLLQSTTDSGVREMMGRHFDAAMNLHLMLDNKPVGVPWTQIVGSGESTILRLSSGATYKNEPMCASHPQAPCLASWWRIEWGNGDGTVALRGAQDAGPDHLYYVAGISHAFMPGNSQVTDFIVNLLRHMKDPNSVPKPSLGSYPTSWSGTQYTYFSPVDVHVYDDTTGRHAGKKAGGGVENNIDGVKYEITGETQDVFIPDDGREYRIEVVGAGRGLLDVHVTRYVDAKPVSREVYNKLPVTPNFRAGFKVPKGRERHLLQVDPAGSGVRTPKNPDVLLTQQDLKDILPPQTNLQVLGTMGQNGWYTSEVEVVLTGTDQQGGTGLLGTWYSLNGSADLEQYRAPIRLKADGTTVIRAGSTDKAGNDEPKGVTATIKIDAEAPQAEVVLNGQGNGHAFTGPVQITVTGSDAVSGLASLWIRIDGGDWTRYSGPAQVTAPGMHSVEVRAVDAAGNEGQVKRTEFVIK